MTKHEDHEESKPAHAHAGAPKAAGFFDPDKVARRREFFKGVFDAIANIDPTALMGFLELLKGLLGGLVPASTTTADEEIAETKALEQEIFLEMQPRMPAATAVDPGKLAGWIAFFKMLFSLFAKPAPKPAALAIGDRLDAIAQIGKFLAKLDSDRINQIIAQLTAFLKLILSWFGVPETPASHSLATEEVTTITALWSDDTVNTKAIDLGAIYALIQLILQLISLFKKPQSAAAAADDRDKASHNTAKE